MAKKKPISPKTPPGDRAFLDRMDRETPVGTNVRRALNGIRKVSPDAGDAIQQGLDTLGYRDYANKESWDALRRIQVQDSADRLKNKQASDLMKQNQPRKKGK